MTQELSEADLVQFSSGIFSKEPMFELCVNEARFGLARVLPILLSFNQQTVEVLEVGAGPCILAAYLASKGLHVTAIEPLGQEFDFLADLQVRVLEFCRSNSIELKLVRVEGEQLDLPSRFDVAFTINSLEHMREPLLTIDNMYNSLKSGGIALVHCPNYTIPFDTHFNIFLLTRSKPINKWLYRSKISRYPKVWDELNFVRYIDLRRHLVSRRASFSFDNSITRDLVMRLTDDSIFAKRMPAIGRVTGAVLRHTGLLRALTWLPICLQTPMEVQIRKDSAPASHSGLG